VSAARRYFIALGSNVGSRESNLAGGWERLICACGNGRLSRIYRTRPMYVADQPDYLNAVGEVSSSLEPREMLDLLHRIEGELGRDRSREVRMGPRTLDLDILLCGDLSMETPDLVIPHPRIQERLFVLVPLLELFPEARDPRTGAPYAEARNRLLIDSGASGSPITPI
jgi:2-amino-4-hydroxy-6-hydroxymethyldihydropteridine diphosphokinase